MIENITGPADNPRKLFEDWEIGPVNPETGERNTTLYGSLSNCRDSSTTAFGTRRLTLIDGLACYLARQQTVRLVRLSGECSTVFVGCGEWMTWGSNVWFISLSGRCSR